RIERKLRAERGREPSSQEIADELELPVEDVDQVRRTAQVPVSLSQPIGDSDEAEFGDLLVDEGEEQPDEQVDTILRNETLRRLLGTLPTRERQILESRYGLDGGQPSTLSELGHRFNITRERIRQLEKKSLNSLHALARAESVETERRQVS